MTRCQARTLRGGKCQFKAVGAGLCGLHILRWVKRSSQRRNTTEG